MWHDVLHVGLAALGLLADPAPPAPSSDSGNDVVIAVIGVAGPLVLGLITLIVTSGGRRAAAPPAAPPPIPLNANPDNDTEDDAELRALRMRNKALEVFLWRNGMNPTLIRTGEVETVADVRIS